MIEVLDLFSGAGGLHLASESTGKFRTIAFSETDKHASATLERKWPGIPNIGDITKVEKFPPAKVIMGGFPCQDISIGNPSGKGLQGSRSGLWFFMLKAIKQTKPSGVLIENSDQLRKKGLRDVLSGLASAGYDAEWYTVTASSIGAPHKRKRICVVAYRQCAGGERLGESFRLRKCGSWQWSGAKDLQQIYDSPYLPGSRWPQPLLRRMDDGLANRTHRLRQVGNGVVVPLFSQFCDLLWWRMVERGMA